MLRNCLLQSALPRGQVIIANLLSRALRGYDENRGGEPGVAVAESGGKGFLDLAPDPLSDRFVGLLLVDKAAGGAHDAGVLSFFLRGRGDDVGRLAVNFDRPPAGNGEEGS